MPNEDVESDGTEPLPEDTEPLEVKVTNQKEIKQWNDSYENENYDEHNITDEEIKEHDNGDT